MHHNSLKNLMLFLGLIFFSYSISLMTSIPFFPLTFLFFLSAIYIINILKQLKILRLVTLFILLLFIHILLLLYQINYKNLPLGGVDWLVYDMWAHQSINLNGSNIFHILTGKENLFVKIVALLYVFTNNSIGFIYFFVFFCSLVLLYYLLKIQNVLSVSDSKFQFVPLIFFIWPIEVIMSVTFLREIPIQMCLVISFYYLLIFEKKRKLSYACLSLLFAIFSAMMHAGTIGIFFVFFAYLILNNSNKKIKITPAKILIAFFLLVILLNSPLWASMTQKFTNLNLESNSEGVSLGVQAGSTAYITKTSFSNPFEMILYTPYRFFMYEFSPLPWQINSLSTAIAFLIDSIPRYILIFIIFRKFKKNKGKLSSISYLLLITIIVTDLIFCWGTNNYGTAIRHRAKILPLEILLAFLPIKKSRTLLTERTDKEKNL